MALTIVPLSFRQLCMYVAQHHRHNKPPRGGKVFIGAEWHGVLVGAASIGRPNARAYDPKRVAEITRTCTEGTPHVNSKLYGACRQIAKSMGYWKIITYTQAGESGASLRAAGFVKEAELPPRNNWALSSQKLRHLRDETEASDVARVRWAITFKQVHKETTIEWP